MFYPISSKESVNFCASEIWTIIAHHSFWQIIGCKYFPKLHYSGRCRTMRTYDLNIYPLRICIYDHQVQVLCKSNGSEFCGISEKFYEILPKSVKFREWIFGEISLASIVSALPKLRADVRNFTSHIRWRWQNFVRNFVSGSEVWKEILQVGVKFQFHNEISNALFVRGKFGTKILFGDWNFVYHLWSLHKGHKMQNANWGKKKFTDCSPCWKT